MLALHLSPAWKTRTINKVISAANAANTNTASVTLFFLDKLLAKLNTTRAAMAGGE
jgi:hypothetical protein